MQNSNYKRWWVIAFVAMVILNLATLGTLWYTGNHSEYDKQSSKHVKGGADLFLIKELKLDSTQQIAYKLLVKEHRKVISDLKQEAKEAKESFFQLLKDSTTTQEAIITSAAKVAAINQQIDVQTYQHFKNLRALCNSDQRNHFDEIIKDVMRMMGPSNNPPPPHRNPPQEGKEGEGIENRPPPPSDGNGAPPPPPPGE